MMELNHEQADTAWRLLNDFEFACRHVIKIEPKDLEEDVDAEGAKTQALIDVLKGEESTAGMIPLIWRPGQRKLYTAVQEQLKLTGRVRKALVKPRQVGWSALIQALSKWLAEKRPGFRIHTVSHTNESTRKFLRRIRKMCAATPPNIVQGRQVENSKEIVWSNGATHTIATAGSPDSMRSDSCHFLHGSEIPYWEAMIEALAAIIPALSDGPSSYGFLESSSKGKGNPWHQFILETLAGENEWEVFFDAWFNHPGYRKPPPPGWQPDEEALEEQRLYNLSIDQLYWRAMRIKSLRANWLFRQEYPSTIEDSFQSSADTLYNPDAVNRARQNGVRHFIPLDGNAPLIMGIDPARTGDRTVIAFRQGNVFREVLTWPKMDDMRLVGIIAEFLQKGFEKTRVSKCFIDYAIGEGAASRLRELGFFREVQTIHFGQAANSDRYANKRAEMFMDMRDWFGDTGEQVSIPDRDDVHADLLAIPDFLQSTGSEKIKLAPKEVIKKDFGRSPDIADAMALTFAFPVRAEKVAELQQFAKNNLGHLPPDELSSVLRDFG